METSVEAMDMNACHLSEKTLAALEAATKEDLIFLSWDLFLGGGFDPRGSMGLVYLPTFTIKIN